MPTGEANLFGLHEYDYKQQFFDGPPILSQGAGYGVLVGFGAVFALVTVLALWLDINFAGHHTHSENFQTAGRRIKTGLISVDVVSHWTWTFTLLQSSTVAFKYGACGPFWFSAGATLQIMLFGVMAIQVKRKAPNCHTILEVVRLRWGIPAHLVFFYLFFINNLFITSTLIVGASSVITTLTGVSVEASCMLIPLGIVIYCVAGGLKAAFISSYMHSVIIFAVIAALIFTVFAPSNPNADQLGSIHQVYQNLLVRAKAVPVVGNKGGSLLTMFSVGGLEFGFIFLSTCFGWVWADQGFWQSAIAARPEAAYKGYILGGMLWFAVPFSMATTIGLAGLALDLPMSAQEIGQALVPPAVAYHLLGKGGVILIVIVVFMAVTSSGSAELVAVSSLVSYDVYRTYINPKATGKQVLLVSRLTVLIFGVFSGVFCIGLVHAGIDISWLFSVIGLLVASVFPPISLLLLWNAVPAGAAIAAALGGQILAIIAWLSSTAIQYGELTVLTTSYNGPSLSGNIVATLSSAIICIMWTLIAPDKNTSWLQLRTALSNNVPVLDGVMIEESDEEAAQMKRALRVTLWWALALSIVTFLLWPLLTLAAGTVWSEGYFTFWIVLSIVWGLVAGLIVTFYPLIESRKVILRILTCRPKRGTHNVPSSSSLSSNEPAETPKGPKGYNPEDTPPKLGNKTLPKAAKLTVHDADTAISVQPESKP